MIEASASASPQVLLRPATADDISLIQETWLRSYWRGGRAPRVAPAVYWAEHKRLIRGILSRAAVIVACSPEDLSQVFGWCAHERIGGLSVLHYCYVKQPFRRLGLAAHLLRVVTSGATGVQHTHRTRDGERLGVTSVFNPYLAAGV